MASFTALKENCCEANRMLPSYGLVDLTFGNLSVIDRASGCFAIKPSGVAYEELRPEDIVVVDLEGKIVEGTLRPSSDTPTHRRILQAFPSATAVVHTHSRNATAFAQAGRAIPCLGTTHADYFHGEVPLTRPMSRTEISAHYEWETGNVIVERFQKGNIDPAHVPAVLVRGHAPFAWGTTIGQAVENALALEIIADLARKTLQLDPGATPLPQPLIEKHFQRKHGEGAYYGQS
jgi:L-ribulose-5-phosphate 4-epimerase